MIDLEKLAGLDRERGPRGDMDLSAIVAELRAARELAERFRFVLSGGPTIVGRGGDLDELLERYEAARDGGGK